MAKFKRQKAALKGDNQVIKIALAGNPNVGKSTVFNALTGLKQHTGNWPGKTVSNASGMVYFKDKTYQIYDLPGTYSLIAHSEEEEVARNFICFGGALATIVVCDACALERNLNLVLQILEITPNVILCVNLMDEAKKKQISVNLDLLAQKLGIPVIGTSARNKEGLTELLNILYENNYQKGNNIVRYSKPLEEALTSLSDCLMAYDLKALNQRWVALELLIQDETILNELNKYLGYNLLEKEDIKSNLLTINSYLNDEGIFATNLKNNVANVLVSKAEEIAQAVTTFKDEDYHRKDYFLDKILTNKITGIPLMLGMLLIIFWLTIIGANYPSTLLFNFFNYGKDILAKVFDFLLIPNFLKEFLLSGVYQVVTWVVAVMLPPMLIFFPLFTFLEDLGVLPRIAFNLDYYFAKSNACGKQALTMCMGLGCNAVGVTGARIIDSKRERLLAILTNNFVPCNGRFPTIISLITMFFIGYKASFINSFLSAFYLALVIVLGILLTFIISYFLSKTFLKGEPSSFTLELPSYRKPKLGDIIVRSILDRTFFVLTRAVKVAIPAGAVIYVLANVKVGNVSLLSHLSSFLDLFGHLFGMDGVIILAFILGIPANEIVMPIILMSYLATSSLVSIDDLALLKSILVSHGWTTITALCTIIFTLFHFPCATTILTIKKEANSFKWTILAFLIPTLIGLIITFSLNTILSLI